MRHLFTATALMLSFGVQALDFSLPWGHSQINDHRLEELIAHPAVQRLHKIDQSGPVSYLGLIPHFSRFEHSIGVLALLHHKAGASFPECAAGLLHDVSHTAFSHLADQLFYKADQEHSYQDMIHLEFLKEFQIDKTAQKFGLSLSQLDPDRPEYSALERSAPDLCADRIEYLLHTADKLKIYDNNDIENIVNDLEYSDNLWFFNSIEQAEKFAVLSLQFTKEIYGSPWNTAIYYVFADILRDAMNEGIIDASTILYGTDQQILSLIKNKGSAALIAKMKKIESDPLNCYAVVADEQIATFYVRPKFRGVDPLIKINEGNFQRLTAVSEKYAAEFTSLKQWCADGYGVKILI